MNTFTREHLLPRVFLDDFDSGCLALSGNCSERVLNLLANENTPA